MSDGVLPTLLVVLVIRELHCDVLVDACNKVINKIYKFYKSIKNCALLQNYVDNRFQPVSFREMTLAKYSFMFESKEFFI